MKNRVEEIRKARGIRQEDFAKAMGVSRQTISSLETGRYNPSINLAYKIAKYFGMIIEEVFIFEEDEKMYNRRNLITAIVYITIGMSLHIFCTYGVIDEYWASFGIAIAAVGVVNLIRVIRYNNNAEYREKVDLSNTDERNKFL